MKVLSLFSGIGAFEKGLTNIGKDYQVVGFSEIDKYAIESYCAIHNVDKSKNLGDISKIKNEELPDANLITYGFPCQDISVAGLGKGISKGTRSGLLYEAERIIKHVKPKYAIAENVKNLVGKKHKKDFEKMLDRLVSYGYNNYWKVLNAKDYGIPQNRERVFIVSIRKDIDDGKFEFPKGFDNNMDFKDILDEYTNSEVILNKKSLEQIKNTKYKGTNGYKDMTNDLIEGEIEKDLVMDYRYDEGLRIRKNNLVPTLKTGRGLSCLPIFYINKQFRFISPLESWKTMGFTNDDYFKIKEIICGNKTIPISQLYKMAGNSIVVNVVEEIFKSLF